MNREAAARYPDYPGILTKTQDQLKEKSRARQKINIKTFPGMIFLRRKPEKNIKAKHRGYG
ncbi:MAG: hypothetical protein PHV39_06615 [Methanomicrobium sp.]|nr:hypothetical protein [Methanomicrobium sp.]